MRSDSLFLAEEVSQLSTSTSRRVSLSSSDVRGTLSFLSQVEFAPKGPDSKEGPISIQWLIFRSSFISQDEGMSESPVETLEKVIGFRLICTGDLTSH